MFYRRRSQGHVSMAAAVEGGDGEWELSVNIFRWW